MQDTSALNDTFDIAKMVEQELVRPPSLRRLPKVQPMLDTPDTTEALLTDRNTTHGDFGDNARVSQSLKRTLRAEPGWELLTDTEREAMDMIALKFSRLLSGKALELQHWEDVVGYAKLAERLCKSPS